MQLHVSDSRKWWNIIGGPRRYVNHGISPDEFCTHFSKVNNPEDNSFFTPCEEVRNCNFDDFSCKFPELERAITSEELTKNLRKLKNNKSPGSDLWTNEMLKFITSIHPLLLKIYNKVFDARYYPEEWAKGLVKPLHKKGEIGDPNNYRGITLISVVGKLFTRIINSRLTEWADKYEFYFAGQAGFRSGHSTMDNIFILNSIINKTIDKKGRLYAFFIDLSKCFDKIVRENVFYKLVNIGIGNKIIDVIKSLYSHVKCIIRDNNVDSTFGFLCALGVLQGECLSPTLFAFLVNDLADFLKQSANNVLSWKDIQLYLLLYADDMVYISADPVEFQEGIDIISQYCKKWNFVINTNKSKIVVFRKCKNARTPVFNYNGIVIENVDSMDYLGTTFNYNGSWFVNGKGRIAKAKRALYALKQKCFRFRFPVKVVINLFNALVESVLLYGCEVWGYNPPHNLDTIHLGFIKEMLRLKKSTPNYFVLLETGELSMSYKVKYRMLCYWSSLVKSDKGKLSQKVYDLQLPGFTSKWLTCVRNDLIDLDMFDYWVDQDIDVSRDVFKKAVKKGLYHLQNREALEFFEGSNKALLFKQLVHDKEPSKMAWYLEHLTDPSIYRSIAAIRLRNHRLSVETGSWDGTDFNARLCTQCNILEDEFHFVLQCTRYNALRHKFIHSDHSTRPNMLKFIQLLNTEDICILNRLGIFLKRSFKLHRNINNVA